LTLAFNLVVVALVVIWLALVYWTFADARRRIEDRFLVTCATVAALFPFIGSLIYLIVRPPEYLEDVRERELEMAAAEARLEAATAPQSVHSCPHCDEQIEQDFIRCPSCLRRLREPCPSCEKPLDPEWRICPYCEADPKQGARKRVPRAKADSGDGDERKPAPTRAPARKAAPKASSQSAKAAPAAERSASRQTAKARARQAAEQTEPKSNQTGEPETAS
jgi:hypothetical protein